MSKRGPSQDGEAAQIALAIERAVELRDDPELPPEQRLERAVLRVERQVGDWEDITPGTNLDARTVAVERLLGRIAYTVAQSERAHVSDPFAYAVRRLETAPGAARKKRVNELRNKGWTESRRDQAYKQAADKATRNVLENHGARLWWEQPGNHERLNRLQEALSDDTVVSRAA